MLSKNLALPWHKYGSSFFTEERINYCKANIKQILETYEEAIKIRNRKDGIKGIEKQVADYIESLNDTNRIIFLKQQPLRTLEDMCSHQEFRKLVKEVVKII